MQKFYSIADHIVTLRADDDSPVWEVCGNYAPFETETREAPVCSLEIRDSLDIPQAESIYEVREKGYPRLVLSHFSGGWAVEMAPESELPTVADLLTSEDFSSGALALLPSGKASARFAVDNALMLMFAISTAALGTLEIHSSVTVCDGRGYAFLGKSGTGKSTHSRLWKENIPGSRLLNDDNPVIRIKDGEVRIYGSPWSGKTPCYKAESAPLGAVVRISQNPGNSIHRLSPVEAYASMYSSCSAFREIRGTADGIHSTLVQLVGSVPMYRLECRPDREAAELCHNTVSR
jgi:hypothetical protein